MSQKSDGPGKGRSRLSPEPVPRRDVLGLAAAGSAGAALLVAGIGMLRLPKAAVLPSPSRKFRVSLPESLPPGAPFQPPGRPVAVYRDAEGVWAVSLICTHLGCVVKTIAEGFECPCHGSRFDQEGAVTKGPAPRGLAWYAVSKTGPDSYLVDLGTEVPAGVKEKA